MTYAHPVFLSYKHSPTFDYWVPQYFHHLLADWLGQFLAGHEYDREMFLDTREIKPGQDWRNSIGSGLNQSCVLLALLSPKYFDSEMCWAEWLTFRRRAAQCAQVLLVPVLVCDGPNIPLEARAIQYADLTDYVTLSEGFRRTDRFLDFEARVKALAKYLADCVRKAPPHDPTWTFVDPAQPEVQQRIAKPRTLLMPTLAA